MPKLTIINSDESMEGRKDGLTMIVENLCFKRL